MGRGALGALDETGVVVPRHAGSFQVLEISKDQAVHSSDNDQVFSCRL
jgi:hypothetical protein